MSRHIKSLVNKINFRYTENFMKNETANNLLEKIAKNMDKSKDKIIKPKHEYFRTPNEQIAYGDLSIGYKYLGGIINSRNWYLKDDLNDILINIRNILSDKTGQSFNSVLISRYINGNDYIGEHSDVNLVENSSIVGISLGATREMILKRKYIREENENEDTICISLNHGSMYEIDYTTNKYWKHSIKMDSGIVDHRICITYRNINKSIIDNNGKK